MIALPVAGFLRQFRLRNSESQIHAFALENVLMQFMFRRAVAFLKILSRRQQQVASNAASLSSSIYDHKM